MNATLFRRVTNGAIIANLGLVGVAQIVTEHEALFEAGHNLLLGWFGVELAMELRSHGWAYLRRPLHAFDAAVIVLSLLPALGLDAALLRVCRLARLIHLGRHVSGLRVVRFVRVGRMLPAR